MRKRRPSYALTSTSFEATVIAGRGLCFVVGWLTEYHFSVGELITVVDGEYIGDYRVRGIEKHGSLRCFFKVLLIVAPATDDEIHYEDSPEIMRHFEYAHLPEKLQAVSQPFCSLANQMLSLPDGEERTVCLRKLLEAKDCAVRAARS